MRATQKASMEISMLLPEFLLSGCRSRKGNGKGLNLRVVRREMNDLLGRFWNPQKQAFGEGVASYVPTINFKETDENFELTAEVPGMQPEDIELNLTGDLLTIKGEKKEEVAGSYHPYYSQP